ncbi:MAG: glycoside hydrolase family 3 C-terminal domain-containing protein [Lachnospiraceae bacterium]|nr:glycoside hydrolase family 3 C-terminal domain-containing protein [Candidatus Colinaster scatohippi]
MNREEARKKAIELVAKMSIEEKASQLRYDSPAIERLGIPAYNWWGEGLHGVARAGVATVFPQAIAMAATFDTDMAQATGDVVSTEGRAKYNEYSKHEDRDIYKGLSFWSPNVNIFRDPRWGRGHETYGEDPYLTSKLGIAFVKGLQGDGDTMKIAACAKHFVAHSGPEALRHGFDVEPSKKDFEETYLPAFEALVKDADVEAVMGAYNSIYGMPCNGNSYIMKDILRDKWGFKGHYVSDCWAVRDFHENHKVTKTMEESAALAINSGCDLNCGNTYLYMFKAYKDGLVSEEAITEAAVRLFTTRYLLGMFDGSEYDSIPYSVVECEEHLKLADKSALESVVLLKNNNILPIDIKKTKTIGVIGPNANSRVALVGNYHGTSSEYVTVCEGIQEYIRDNKLDTRVLYSDGCHLFMNKTENLAFEDDRIAEAVITAEQSDVVILCVGLDETLEGEEGDTGNSYASGDKESLLLPESQRRLVEAIAKTGKPVVYCNMTGSAMDLSFAIDNFDGIMQLWYPGARGGRAVAKLLFGDVSPSGKLPVTFYESLDKMPDFEDYSMKGRTYRHMDYDAQFPFGYGLTYSDVCVKSIDIITIDKAATGYTSKVTVTVSNDGNVNTDEVVQLYIKSDDKNAAINPVLCGFKRINLKAGESKKITMEIEPKSFTVVDDEGQRYTPDGVFTVYAGVNAPDRVSERLTGKKCISVQIS